ncbi:hypothetical protein V6N11_083835 [Hibiscus sabdariffa]|uniref:RNase H type-1 domain-containing protein n=1 Tax=Hibiscus sabdariffa TaxID=183260 RepID=A0ABR2QD56_9ROSI
MSEARFWFDSWIPKLGPLIHWKLDMVGANYDLKVSQFVLPNGSWNWIVLRQLLHPHALAHFLDIPTLAIIVGLDRCIWEPGKHGKFSAKTWALQFILASASPSSNPNPFDPTISRWAPAPCGWFTLNTDGAVNTTSSFGSTGGLICDSEGGMVNWL